MKSAHENVIRIAARCGCVMALLAAGCGNQNGPTGSNSSAVCQGQVQDSNGAPVSGASVSAFRVEADGSLTAISTVAVKTDAQGRYSLGVDVAAGTMEQIVVTANSAGSAIGSAAIEGAFAANATIQAPPIDATATAVADMLVDAKASGQWKGGFSLGCLRALAGGQLAAALGANVDAATLKAAATAALAAMSAFEATLDAQGVTSAQHDASLQAIATAEAALDAQLDTAAGADARAAALAAFFSAFVQAHTAAGITVAQLSSAAIAAADATAAFSAALSAEAEARARAGIAAAQASMVTAAVNAELQAMGASAATLQACSQAGATLQAQIAAAAQAGAGAGADVTQAWTTYEATVSAQIAAALSIPVQVFAALQTAITADLQALLAERSSLAAAASVGAGAQAEAQALLQFAAVVAGHSSMLTTVGVGQAQAAACLHVLFELAACGGH